MQRGFLDHRHSQIWTENYVQIFCIHGELTAVALVFGPLNIMAGNDQEDRDRADVATDSEIMAATGKDAAAHDSQDRCSWPRTVVVSQGEAASSQCLFVAVGSG